MSNLARLPSLALPFGLIGLVGGALTARAFGPHPFDFQHGGAIIVLTTTMVAVRLGRRLAERFAAATCMRPSWLEVTGRALLAGATNGVFLLALLIVDNLGLPQSDCALAIFPGSVCAAMFGAVVAVPFVPSLLLLAAAHGRVVEARPGSLVAGVLARRVWLLTAATAALHVGAVLWATRGRMAWHVPAGETNLIAAMGLLAGAAALVLAVLEVASFARLRRAARAAAGLTRLDGLQSSAAIVEPAADFLDVGIGAERFVTVEAGDDPYRAADRAVPRMAGNPAAARAALLEAAGADAVTLVLILAPLALLLVWAQVR